MIRGVNKQIIEINETENEYFEKAILFVRPKKCDTGEAKLREAASGWLAPMGLAQRGRKKKMSRFLRMLCAAVAGGAVAAVIMLVLR